MISNAALTKQPKAEIMPKAKTTSLSRYSAFMRGSFMSRDYRAGPG